MQGYSLCCGGVEVSISPPADGKGADGRTMTPQQWIQLAAIIIQALLSFFGGGAAGEQAAQPGSGRPAADAGGSKPR